ncbi:MAG: winged helix-turn-helix domain-containing protein [Pseudomonadota bacterium]|nr:winged helix-turn-helix domain-containing protein [Pseudomonadota bacterium]MEC9458606.1 winged helix-turn-helix domain-containing protein [Pseudomonadota bacterium]
MGKKFNIAIVSNNNDLLALLDETFKLHKKFNTYIFNSSDLNHIKKNDINFEIVVMSEDIYEIITNESTLWEEIDQNLILLIDEKKDKNFIDNKKIKPRSIIDLPLNFTSTVKILDSIIRENSNKLSNIEIEGFTLDVSGRKITMKNNSEKLTEKETSILWHLLNKKDSKILQKNLLKDIWGYDEGIQTRTLETHIYRIRKKLNNIGANNFKIKNLDNSYILKIS